MDYDAPLRWEHEDGRSGTAVGDIPHEGRVFFYDEAGPVGRFDDVAEARWWCLHKVGLATGAEMDFRVVRLTDKDGGKHYLMPGRIGVIDCDETHPCNGAHPCVVVDEICNEIFRGAV